jgi:hypothetical protein
MMVEKQETRKSLTLIIKMRNKRKEIGVQRGEKR